MILRTLAELAVLAGSLVALLAAFGLLRFDSPYARFHAAGKASPVALLVASLGAAPLLGWVGSVYLAISAAGMILTIPLGVHLLFRAVHRSPQAPLLTVDELTVELTVDELTVDELTVEEPERPASEPTPEET